MLILGLESSCDETGVALVAFDPGSPGLPQLRAQALHTQIDMHKAYGGVVPELASRDHIRRVVPLVRQVMEEGGRALADLDVVAYTAGPGHLLSPFLSADPPAFPFVALLVSGGHTQLMQVQGVGQYALLGESIDDAAGEAFDKCAKLIGLDYPGGAALSRLAQQGRPDAYAFPRPLLHSGDLDFSFAGLKTSVATQVQRLLQAAQDGGAPGLSEAQRADVAASTQAAIVEVLVRKSLSALKRTGLRRLVVAGGVGANHELRAQLDAACARMQARVHYPELALCTDNGAMIAMAAAMRLQAGIQQPAAAGAFEVMPRWPFAVAAPA
jgi:N6-L-threonylcarbamoyladenine synthase